MLNTCSSTQSQSEGAESKFNRRKYNQGRWHEGLGVWRVSRGDDTIGSNGFSDIITHISAVFRYDTVSACTSSLIGGCSKK